MSMRVLCMPRWALLFVALCAAKSLRGQTEDPEKHNVSTVDLFGYSGWDRDDPHTADVRKQLAARVGAEVTLTSVARFRRKVQGDVVAATGKPATDVAVICCDVKGELNVFVGIEGEEAIPLEQRATPVGPDMLPPEALTIYQDYEKAMQAATSHGLLQQDDTQGYALSSDPALRHVEERMRAFALDHSDAFQQVVRHAGAVQQRRAAAALLGYAQRSPSQIRALLDGMMDDDEGVRNNAARALGVLAAAGPLPGLNIKQVLGLLYSGVWSDRVNASVLLSRLTLGRDAKLMKLLREQALPPLVEGAQWQSKPYAMPFSVVLGRLTGLPDDRINALLANGQVEEIVRAGKAQERGGERP